MQSTAPNNQQAYRNYTAKKTTRAISFLFSLSLFSLLFNKSTKIL
jgi:hypothetical protein